MKQYTQAGIILLLAAGVITISCKKDAGSSTGTTAGSSSSGTATLPDVFKKFNSNVVISTDGTTITIKSDGVPDHKSCYFASSDSRYQAYNGSNPAFSKNPNSIGTKNYTFKIPANPAVNAAHEATPLGPIGVAINGVPIYNQYAGPNQPLGSEINSFDQYNGHPDQSSAYHYHVEPLYITANKTKSALIGFLLDGFPVYGPEENGKTLTSADLDTYHGHFGATADYPNGIYHYHTTADAPYINGAGFYGTKGSVTQ
ncbi:MAG TPA: YHYH protein [Sediminibacterium sp.]|nr:YHYH protein [Sediminibacterium sp.]